LVQRPVQNLNWAIATDDPQAPDHPFDWHVVSFKRGAILNWFGTAGIHDFTLHAKATRLIGDLCLRLRWNESRGDGLSVLLSRDQLYFQEMQGTHVRQSHRVPRSSGNRGFDAQVSVRGDTLDIQLDGRPVLHVDHLAEHNPETGLLQLFLVDKFRGSAQVDRLDLEYQP